MRSNHAQFLLLLGILSCYNHFFRDSRTPNNETYFLMRALARASAKKPEEIAMEYQEREREARRSTPLVRSRSGSFIPRGSLGDRELLSPSKEKTDNEVLASNSYDMYYKSQMLPPTSHDAREVYFSEVSQGVRIRALIPSFDSDAFQS